MSTALLGFFLFLRFFFTGNGTEFCIYFIRNFILSLSFSITTVLLGFTGFRFRRVLTPTRFT